MARRRLTDRRGLPLSTRSVEAAERYDRAVELMLSANAGRDEELARAVEADEGFALAQAAMALAHHVQGEMAAAKESAERARTAARGATRRERQHVEVVARTVGGDAPGALALVHEHLAEFARDALLLSQSAVLSNASGRADRNAVHLAFLSALAPAYGDDWCFLGTYGFFHHELDRFDESRRLSERSLELYPRNGAATHSLAHVFYETDDHASGRGFLDVWMGDYPREAPLHCHLSWHQALFELAAGRYGRVMELYARDLNPTLGRARAEQGDPAGARESFDLAGRAWQGAEPTAPEQIAFRSARRGVAAAPVG